MKHMIRTAALTNRIKLSDPAASAAQLIPLLDLAIEQQADLISAPLFTLTGGKLFSVPSFAEEVDKQIALLAARYAEKDVPIVLGKGERLCILYGGKVYPAESSTCFRCGDAVIAAAALDYHRLPLLCGKLAETGADILLCSSYHPYKAGDSKAARRVFQMIGSALGMSFVFVNGGLGDTSSPYLYKGYSGIVEAERVLSFSDNSNKGGVLLCDLDLDIIRSCKAKAGTPHFAGEALFSAPCREHDKLLRPLSIDPYLPEEQDKEAEFLEAVFDCQVKSLADRMANTGLHHLVLGISGGLDSTLAFLVAAAAVDRLSLPRTNIIGVTMPGFGTTGQTYVNAVGLIKSLGAVFREVNISASVTQHLNDIKHPLDKTDVTYENAQARERAQILLDIANDNRAFVVGTGDLSEEALGWCTFAGDHIANYNVNVCVTKTMIRKIVSMLAEQKRFADASEVLTDILHSPVSPELLPPDENGLMVQKTEEILGPYELHDFFLYYFVKYALPPEKIYAYACQAFSDIAPEFILEKCRLFFRRLTGGQFKRSCAPDAAAITEVNLSNTEFYLPSDGSADALLKDLT